MVSTFATLMPNSLIEVEGDYSWLYRQTTNLRSIIKLYRNNYYFSFKSAPFLLASLFSLVRWLFKVFFKLFISGDAFLRCSSGGN